MQDQRRDGLERCGRVLAQDGRRLPSQSDSEVEKIGTEKRGSPTFVSAAHNVREHTAAMVQALMGSAAVE